MTKLTILALCLLAVVGCGNPVEQAADEGKNAFETGMGRVYFLGAGSGSRSRSQFLRAPRSSRSIPVHSRPLKLFFPVGIPVLVRRPLVAFVVRIAMFFSPLTTF